MKFLGKIDDVFSISGRGPVIVPNWISDLKVKLGDPIQLRSEDGQVKDTLIAGVELLKPAAGNCRAAFLLTRDITKDEITAGMEIWLFDGRDGN